ncbi:MAG: hypothetical protein MUF01_10065 [Bryobacterales bacterium]|jgi:hypothetical protein|nr:hypothetical protein [Bryobacterales bacterium]
MDAPKQGRYLLSSLKAGVEVSALAALGSIAFLVALGRFAGMPWHAYGNLFSTVLYSRDVLEADPGYHTAAGFALVFLYFVACGLLFALAFPSNRKGVGPHLVGICFALALFMAGDRVWWQQISSFIVIYGIHAHLMWTHVVFGAMLGAVSRRRARDVAPPDSVGAEPFTLQA